MTVVLNIPIKIKLKHPSSEYNIIIYKDLLQQQIIYGFIIM